MRIGFGWDLHTLMAGRRLLFGGVEVDAPFGESGHSDGDVLVHALIDALLGALALGDIGSHFPPSDPRWKDVNSMQLLEKTMAMVRERSYRILNLDSTIVLQRPKLSQYIPEIQKNLAAAVGCAESQVSVKAKTKEKVDATGEGRAVEAYAVVLLEALERGGR
ncbi:MAG TPA: 2-C-methyl-D-erythritol 2,4-cyclodiphosphate synthase [Sediminispirochaeta sp.]|nr:2-C-methyl-D-erythritol 2,4-cyclodiphosphate synthase [Sediminispirochaeta sp.]